VVTASAGPEEGLPPGPRWTWEHPIGPRWLLLGDVGFDDSYEDDVPLALCAEIDGLFVDLPARPRERFTLVGCSQSGALAEVLDRLTAEALGTGQAWLGDIYLTAPPPNGPRSWWGEDLGDIVVLAQRPSATVPGTVDIDLSGFVHVDDRTDAVARPSEVTEFVLRSRKDEPYGTCRDLIGVFREQAPPPVPRVRLLGCQPEDSLLTALGAVGDATRAGLRRRRIRAEVYAVDADSGASRVIDAVVSGTVTASEPSRLGVGLVDVTVDSDPREPLPTGILGIIESWHGGRPAEKNLWAGYDRTLRHHWAGVALAHQSPTPDRPVGTRYDLDGRFVTDIEGFYCALGEAINGPGGYFGWNLHAVDDCLCGGFGARPPFRLVWHDAAVARQHLVPGYDRLRLGPATTFEYLVDMLTAHHVELDLR
jgi:hypothetical protein